MGWPQNPMMIPQLKDPHFGETLAQVLGWAGTPITQEKPFLMQYCMRFIRDAEAKLITHTGAEEIDPLQLQLRVLKNKPQSEGRIRPQRMGKPSKHKNGDGELVLKLMERLQAIFGKHSWSLKEWGSWVNIIRMGMVNYSSSLMERLQAIFLQTFLVPYIMGQVPGWVTQWSSFSQAEGKRTKNSMMGFLSRGLRNTLSWGLTPIPGWLDIVVFTSMLSSMLWVQKKVPVDNLKLQGQTPLFQ